jgi:hypothetical protein
MGASGGGSVTHRPAMQRPSSSDVQSPFESQPCKHAELTALWAPHAASLKTSQLVAAWTVLHSALSPQPRVHTPHKQASSSPQSLGASHVRIQLVFVPMSELSVDLAHPSAMSTSPAVITKV